MNFKISSAKCRSFFSVPALIFIFLSVVNCGVFTTFDNKIPNTSDYTANTPISYTCAENFGFLDNSQVKYSLCLVNGQWSPPISDCICKYKPHKARLTHWSRVMHICVGKLNIIGSDNGLSPGRRQAIIWTNARILSIRPLATNFNELLIGIQTFSFTKMYLKMSSAKWRPYCLGLNVLSNCIA